MGIIVLTESSWQPHILFLPLFLVFARILPFPKTACCPKSVEPLTPTLFLECKSLSALGNVARSQPKSEGCWAHLEGAWDEPPLIVYTDVYGSAGSTKS